jgi:hypothetical protein
VTKRVYNIGNVKLKRCDRGDALPEAKGKIRMGLKEKRMPTPTSARIKTGALVTLGLSLVGAVLLLWYNIAFIGEDMLYDSHAPAVLPIGLLLVAISSSVAFSFMLERDKRLNALPQTHDMPHQVICALICATLLAVTVLYFILGTKDLNGGEELTEKLREDISIVLRCYMIYALLAPVAALYFIKSAFGERRISVSLGCVTVVWFILYLVRLYFDLSDMPFSLATNNDELEKNVLAFEEEAYKSALTEFYKSVGMVMDGKSSEKCAEMILKYCGKK